MILFKPWLMGIILWVLLPIAVFEDAGPSYDTGDWIPIVPEKTKSSNRESKSSDRILNIDASGEKFIGEEKLPVKKTYITQLRPRKNPHIKRSPNQRPRIKSEQPYRFENILSPPPKQYLRGFQQKIPYQQPYNHQPQYQFNLVKPGQILNEDSYQTFPGRSNPLVYNLNNLQANPNIPNYSSPQIGIQYQQPGIVYQTASTNNTIYQQPSSTAVNQGLFESIRNQNNEQNIKLATPGNSEDKDTVQLLYVPLEQLQKQQGLLDDAFDSLQKQKLVASPPESDSTLKLPIAQPLVAQQNLQKDFQQEVNQQKYQIHHNQPGIREESQNYQIQNSGRQPEKPAQYYVLQNSPPKNEEEQPRYYELISKNRGELLLQNNPKTVEVSNKQEYQVHAEKQQIVELTSPQPLQNHQVQYDTRFENQKPLHPQIPVQSTRIQDTRGKFLQKEPEVGPSFTVQNQVSQPLTVESPKLQHSYIVRNQPSPIIDNQNNFRDDFQPNAQKSRLQSIQNDILQQTLQVEKLQKQIQQGKSLGFPEKNSSQPSKKRKPHQPPLAVYMGGNQPGDVESVLELLKNAKSIAVQDQIGPNSPQVFIGPSNLSIPDGFAKFPLPYLSSLDNNRIQRKAQQFPFFVAPINYREPEGYSKIPLPSPHVGSVVVSQFKQPQIPDLNDNFHESNRPVAITNYKFVNPTFGSTVDHSHFDDNFNAYSLESHIPRVNTNGHLKEQTLLQQITGFSGFDYPQNQYFSEQRPNIYNQVQGTVSAKPQTNQNQYLEEVQQKPSLNSADEIVPETVSTQPTRQRTRGEKVRGQKKGNGGRNVASAVEEEEKVTQRNIPTPDIKVPEVPTPNIVQDPQKVEISSQNPLTQDFLNRFSSNNNFNFNYVSSTPGYAIPTQSSVEELPANIRKLNVNQSPDVSSIRNSAVIDAQFEQTIENLQNSKQKFVPPKEDKRVHIYNGFEEYEIPAQLSDINPNLPGLINELQQPQYSTPKLETESPIVSTTPSTTQFTIRTTEASTTTTTRKPRGRGRSRFNMRTTTTSPYRRPSGERRRPSKPTVTSTTEAAYENAFNSNRYTPIENEEPKPRTRLQNSLTERVAEGSIESTSNAQQQLQPITRVMEIPQNQPNYYVQFESAVANEKPVLRDYVVEEPKTEGVKFVEQYQSQKVTTAEELASQQKEYSAPLRQISVIQPDRSEPAKAEATQSPSEIEATTRRRVRVRGRPKNKYSSTTIAPRVGSTQENEQNEFYGFIRQPNFSQSSQISSNTRNEEEDIHIYAPTQQKSPIYNSRNNEPTGPSGSRVEAKPTRFLGELRPKYSPPPRATTTQQPETTPKSRIRGRVRVPGKSYESRSKSSDNVSTEKSVRGRTRGRSHFTPPRNTRQEAVIDETENYPAPYLKSREAATTPSGSEFKITVSMDDVEGDQISHSTVNKPLNSRESLVQSNHQVHEGSKNGIHKDEYEVPEENMEIVSFRHKNTKGDGFRVVNVDHFDTAESQNYRTLFNSLDTPHKVNELKSVEMEEGSTEPPSDIYEKQQDSTTTQIPGSQNTSEDDLNTTILESVRESIGNPTVPSFFTTTDTQDDATVDPIETTQNSTNPESTDSIEITSTPSPTTVTSTTTPNPTTEGKLPEQTPLDLMMLKTSTSTEISHETEICFKGRCVKSKNKKFRKRLVRKKVNESNNN